MDDQMTSVPAGSCAEALTKAHTEIVDSVEAEGTQRSASLTFDRRSWLDLG